MVNKIKDLTGQRFGKLTVIKMVEGVRPITWLCKCDCGKFVKVRRGNLVNGSTRSCGCLRADDLTGKRFGKLTVLSRYGTDKHGNATWKCRCDCGNETIAQAEDLKRGLTKSCKCGYEENKHNFGDRIKKHGKRNERIYNIYCGMKARCYNTNNPVYKYYGAKGVNICTEWLKDFMSFYNWAMANGYRKNLTIDRINPFGNYEPSNCRWVTLSEQASNKRNSKCNEKYKQEYPDK